MINRRMSDYASFLASKQRARPDAGLLYADLSPHLFAFQRALVAWACRRGRAAIFADTGLGKTRMQLEWARTMPKPCLIVAPLAVAGQTIAEGERVGVPVVQVARPGDAPIQITNYEKLEHFEGVPYGAIALDESSILKSIDGKTRTRLLSAFTDIPYRLCCTATPAPNDLQELANHSEFLGQMLRREMLASYFVHDDSGWRLKGHARAAFWRWVASWGCWVRTPSDLGYSDDGFALPTLHIDEAVVPTAWRPAGHLFAEVGPGIGGRQEARRATIRERVTCALDLIRAEPAEKWIVWCGLNDEAQAMADALGGEAVEVSGKDSDESKIDKEHAWRTTDTIPRVLITKPKMFGFGMNWQHAARMLFLGIGDSWETYYQAIRRCWRFGQSRPVRVHVVLSEAERKVSANIARKEAQARELAAEVAALVRETQMAEIKDTSGEATAAPAATADASGDGWRMLLGDCVERLAEVETGSVGLSVFSPPFAALYTYSASERDMGNCSSFDEFFEHFRHLLPELLRVTMPGRRAAVHVQQVSTTKATHGVIGWRDFRSEVVREMVAAGWVYDGEVVIDKDPQAQAIRTHSKALLFVQKERDAAWLRPAMADYILLFRHPADNPEPVHGDVSNEEWIAWARPIWYGIDESDTLNAAEARSERDERHICPLQLGTIERCVRLWTNPGDLVLSPFAGIGSEGVVALKHKRRFVGIELKPEYFRCATRNIEASTKQLPLFGAQP